MYGIIYLTTNKINNKKYIGMCKSTHIKNYLGSGKLFKQAVKKYGKENFERIVLQECKTFEELSRAEEYWIKKFNAVESVDFYNLTPGGFGGNSEYLKEYWSKFDDVERKLCRNWSKKDMSGKNNPMFGKTHTEETKKKIGMKSVNRKWNKPNHFGMNNPRSKRVKVSFGGDVKYYDCLKEFSQEFISLTYSTLKNLAQTGRFNKKYNLKIEYV
jgi:group I intron endonuclease